MRRCRILAATAGGFDMRAKRTGLRGLLIAACLGQACFLLDDCGEEGPTSMPTPPPNTPPVISSFSVTPREMVAGGSPAQVSASITDRDGNLLTWSLSVAPSSQATGTFSPTEGSAGAVASQFSPATTSSGPATLLLSAIDRGGGQAQAEVKILVAPRR
jgi:hypothetical protein